MKLTADQARKITEESKLSDLYKEIKEAAERGRTCQEVTYLTKKEFEQLIDDGYTIYAEYGTEQLTQYHDDLMDKYDSILIDWSV
jgi:uncharacterized protein YutD